MTVAGFESRVRHTIGDNSVSPNVNQFTARVQDKYIATHDISFDYKHKSIKNTLNNENK